MQQCVTRADCVGKYSIVENVAIFRECWGVYSFGLWEFEGDAKNLGIDT